MRINEGVWVFRCSRAWVAVLATSTLNPAGSKTERTSS